MCQILRRLGLRVNCEARRAVWPKFIASLVHFQVKQGNQQQCRSTSKAGLIFSKSIKSIAFAISSTVNFDAVIARAVEFPDWHPLIFHGLLHFLSSL